MGLHENWFSDLERLLGKRLIVLRFFDERDMAAAQESVSHSFQITINVVHKRKTQSVLTEESLKRHSKVQSK